jgi:hypothetical protein
MRLECRSLIAHTESLPSEGGVLGDVGKPDLVWALRSEFALDQIIVHRWTRFLGESRFLANALQSFCSKADPPHATLAGNESLEFQLIGDQPIRKLSRSMRLVSFKRSVSAPLGVR